MNVGNILRRARVDVGMTQAEVAASAGMTQSVISAYEGNHRTPTLESMVRLMVALDIDPRELMD